MKKVLLAGVLVFTMAVGAFAVYADSADTNEFPSERGYGNIMEKGNEQNREIDLNNQETKEWRNERQEERINEALKNGTITEEQANERRSHFDEMDKFHEESGFRGADCHDGKTGRKYRRGMMDRNGYQ